MLAEISLMTCFGRAPVANGMPLGVGGGRDEAANSDSLSWIRLSDCHDGGCPGAHCHDPCRSGRTLGSAAQLDSPEPLQHQRDSTRSPTKRCANDRHCDTPQEPSIGL